MSDRVFNILRIFLFSVLVVWGGYTLLSYLAIPVHLQVLVGDEARASIMSACPDGGALCAGLKALPAFVVSTIGWAQPFLWYVIWSVIAFGILAAYSYLQLGRWRIRFSVSPLMLALCFLASLWLTFTVISTGQNGDQPFTRLYEPTPQVYQGADAEGLQVLRENFNRLQEAGCLTQIGTTANGAGLYDVSLLCMQGSFFTRVLPHVFVALSLLFVFLVLGRFLLQILRISTRTALMETVMSTGLGAGVLIALLWLLAIVAHVIGQPIYNAAFGWGLLVVIVLALYKHSLYWLRAFVEKKWTYEGALYTGTLILGWLLVSYLALNFLNVIRPFPIGWDDLGKYINQPRLLVSYGTFIPQLASYQWEYVTSLGFLLFGYENVFSATAAMVINWTAGLIATLTVYAFGRRFLGKGGGLLAALLYYTMPLIGHFSYADMKVDNAVFFVGAMATLAVFVGLFGEESDEEEESEESEEKQEAGSDLRKWIILAGILGGVAFSLKPTSIMTLMALGTVLFGVIVHWYAFVGTVALAFVLYLKEGRLNLADIGTRIYGDPAVFSKPILFGGLLVLGIGLLAYSFFIHKKTIKPVLMQAGIFIGSFFLTIAPWMLYNNIAYGNIIPGIVYSAPNDLTPVFEIGGETAPDAGQDIRSLPPELQVNLEQCRGTAKTEELDRYWGYGSGWSHYLTLPWRSVMNIDSAGYYVTTYPALLLFPLLLLLPFFWMKRGRWLRWLFIGTVFMLVQWALFANGIMWYGIGMFLGLVIGLEALVKRAPDYPSKIASWLLIIASLGTAYSMRFWQYNQQLNLFEYALGKVSYETMRERTIPHYDDIREIMEQRVQANPSRPYTYRIGTFIPYFIPRNLEALPVADHQLDMFNCLYQEHDAALTLQRLQALGFNSIIFDTNTHTIERDPNGSLHKKVQEFVDFINTPGLGLQIPVNDPDGGVAFILIP